MKCKNCGKEIMRYTLPRQGVQWIHLYGGMLRECEPRAMAEPEDD